MVTERQYRKPGRVEYGKWKIVDWRPLGRGGNGIVWKVESDSGELGALKTIKEEKNKYRLARFRREIEFLLRNDDLPGVLPLLDSNLDNGDGDSSVWYVMQLATPVREILGNDPDPDSVVRAAADFAATMEMLSKKGISHRDIKPDNLFFANGRWLVGDFGLVAYPDANPLTEHGRKLGPVDYMAPEMRLNADSADGELADVFSFAKTLWVLLVDAELPLPGPHRPDDESCSLRGRLEYGRVSELDLLLAQCTRHEPIKRPRFSTVARELDSMVNEPPENRDGASTVELQRRISALIASDIEHIDTEQKMRDRLGELHEHVKKQVNVVANDLIQALRGFNVYDGAGDRAHGALREKGTFVFQVATGWSFAAPRPNPPTLVLSSSSGLTDFEDGNCISITVVDMLRTYDSGHGSSSVRIFECVIEGTAGSAAVQREIISMGRSLREEVPEMLRVIIEQLDK